MGGGELRTLPRPSRPPHWQRQLGRRARRVGRHAAHAQAAAPSVRLPCGQGGEEARVPAPALGLLHRRPPRGRARRRGRRHRGRGRRDLQAHHQGAQSPRTPPHRPLSRAPVVGVPRAAPKHLPAVGGDGAQALALGNVPEDDNPTEQTLLCPVDSTLKVGDCVGNRSELHGLLHQSGPKSNIHKEVQQNGECFLLVEVEDREAPYRVLIENRSSAQLKLAAGTFVGKAMTRRCGAASGHFSVSFCQVYSAVRLYSACQEWTMYGIA